MKRGRKRKAGERYPGGRLRQAHDYGSELVQAMRERFGVHYNTALGRAYSAGLLGENADDRYLGGKRFALVYQTVIGGQAYRCPLDDSPRGANDHIPEVSPYDHDWLLWVMDALDVRGLRPYLDQLITRNHTDSGPYWLDALLEGGKHPADKAVLDIACRALDIVAPQTRRIGIVAVRY